MTRVEHPAIPATDIAVLPHAIQRARVRKVATGSDHAIREEITRRVAAGFARGEVYDARPRTFRLRGEHPRRLPPGQRIVVFDDTAFVVDIGRPPQVVVVTTYNQLRAAAA